MGSGVDGRPIGRVQRRRPQRIVGATDNQPLQRQLRRAQRRLCLHQRLATGRLLGLCSHDIDWCQRADFDPSLIVFDEPAGEIVGVLRGFDRLHGIHEIPIRIPHARLRADRCRLQSDLVVLLVDAVGLERRSGCVNLEAAQQRLRESSRQTRLPLWISNIDRARIVEPAVGPAQGVVAAAFPQILRDAGAPVFTHGGRHGRDALGDLLRKSSSPRVSRCRRQIDAVVGFESEDREIAEARRDPGDGNVDVLLHPALDGFLNRQIHPCPGRGVRSAGGRSWWLRHLLHRLLNQRTDVSGVAISGIRLLLGHRRGGHHGRQSYNSPGRSFGHRIPPLGICER